MFSACCSARSVLSSELLLSKHVVIFGNVFFNTTTARASATSTADASSSERESSQDQGGAKLEYSNGHVKLTLTLPSRRERCAFTLRPVNDTVKHFIDYLKVEDKSVEKVTLYSSDGVRIAQHTPIGSLVTRPFTIRIDDASVSIQPPKSAAHSEELQRDSDLNELRNLVAKLYTQLNVGEHEAAREHEIAKRLEVLRCELEPLERERHELTLKAKKHTNRMVWLGMGLMGVQVGIMARLTYFDYSWDIVEPISYFVSYAAVMGAASYYVLTRKDYSYESLTDRIFLRSLHKNAIRRNLDLNRYNELKNSVFELENDLRKLNENKISIKNKQFNTSSNKDGHAAIDK